MGDRKVVDLDGERGGEELEDGEEGEIIIRIRYVRQKSVLNKRKTKPKAKSPIVMNGDLSLSEF